MKFVLSGRQPEKTASGFAPVFRSALLQLAFRLQFRESNRMTGFMRIVPSSRHTGYFRRDAIERGAAVVALRSCNYKSIPVVLATRALWISPKIVI
jgi:hypothetical protein